MPLPPPKADVYSDSDCAICHEPLLIPCDDLPLEPSYMIDDAQLRCSHHFHQSCLLEYAVASPDAHERCALCRANVLDNSGAFIVTIRTENGHTGTIDFGHDINQCSGKSPQICVEKNRLYSRVIIGTRRMGGRALLMHDFCYIL